MTANKLAWKNPAVVLYTLWEYKRFALKPEGPVKKNSSLLIKSRLLYWVKMCGIDLMKVRTPYDT